MFGLGLFEIIIIAVAILLFVRPEDLPKFMYRLGKFYGRLQALYNDFKNQVQRVIEVEKKKEDLPQHIPGEDVFIYKKDKTSHTPSIQNKKQILKKKSLTKKSLKKKSS